ncbi:PHP domain-containing protein [Paenibacillus glycinis]|uniref:Histidinol-phosphatase n=1 Tax=Paenibacillus glycinis TaxID=2697035 RepID=A0ABW9XJC3_9BACL|nr:PHP domain-containing protein [Paenibacillus glycinis]NBD22717.1 histidinol phosphate phosphatase domain-containing protein [Paenibacillus glycinis]
MKVDFHFHLEEGPYSLRWLERTARALAATAPGVGREAETERSALHSLAWVGGVSQALGRRIEQGPFSPDWIERYLAEGRRKGIERFGLVDHLYRFEEFKPYYLNHIRVDDTPLGILQREWLDRVCVTSAAAFIEAARDAAGRDGALSVGVEADYFAGGEAELAALLGTLDVDYVIGSVHFIDGWGFDNPETADRFEDENLESLYARHFALVQRAARSGLFDMIAHPDNLKVFGYRPDEERLAELYRETALAFAEAGVATEVNTGLAYRYPVKEMCPSPELLAAMHACGVPVTFSSDAHFPDDLGTMIDEAVELAKRIGYTEAVWFKDGRRHTCGL